MCTLYTELEQIRTNFWWCALMSQIGIGSQFQSLVSQFQGLAAAISCGSGAHSKSYRLWLSSCFCLCTSWAASTVAILVQTICMFILWLQNPQPYTCHHGFWVSLEYLVLYCISEVSVILVFLDVSRVLVLSSMSSMHRVILSLIQLWSSYSCGSSDSFLPVLRSLICCICLQVFVYKVFANSTHATNAPCYIALCQKYFLLDLTVCASIIWECPPCVNLNLFLATVFLCIMVQALAARLRTTHVCFCCNLETCLAIQHPYQVKFRARK